MAVKRRFTNLREPLIRRGWLVMVLLGLIAVFIEIAEHYRFYGASEQSEFVIEFILHGLLTPIIGIILLGLLERAEGERLHLSHHLTSQKEIRDRLARAKNWDELVKVVLRFSFTMTPILGTSLWVVKPDSTQLELAGLIGRDAESLSTVEKLIPCSGCIESPPDPDGTLTGRDCCVQTPISGSYSQLCLKLFHAEKRIGQLLFLFPVDKSIDKDQVQFFGSLAPDIAMAIDGAILEQQALLQRDATEAEKRKIAQNLHDVIGQNLAFLLHKLEQLSGDHSLNKILEVRHDLKRMYDIANEAYQMVRGTLVTLEPSFPGELNTNLHEYAQWIGGQANLQLDFSSEGRPIPVSNDFKNQVFLIFREIYTNIEKHAQARHVKIRLQWEQDCFTLVISDDGRGFNVDQANLPGHYGLVFMKERAMQLSGEIKLASSLNAGTEITLSCPLNQARNPLAEPESSRLVKEIITGPIDENINR